MAKSDGYLKIKTKLDNSDVDKDIKTLEDKIKKLEIDNMNKSNEQRELQEEIDSYNKLTQKADEYNQKIKELNQEKKNMVAENPNLSVSTSPELERLNSQIELMKQKYTEATNEIDKQAPKIDKIYSKLAKVKSKQEENNLKIAEFKAKIDQINISKMEKGIDSVGKGITKTIGRIGKMALAVFGIRTAINAVRNAMNTLSQYNPQIAADINYIRFALAQMLLPVVQKLINMAYTLLQYINQITQAWFGINLFANASAKSFKSGAKSAKEIKKSLQGFDEMNVLSDDSNSSSDIAGPSMDLSSMQGDRPEWLQWIIDNKDLIISAMLGIAGGLIAMKLGFEGVKALGIGIAIAAIVQLIQDIVKFIKEPSWKNWFNILRDIAVAITGVALAIGAWPAVIVGVIALILVEIVKHWDKVKEILGKVGNWLYEHVIVPVVDTFKDLWDNICNIFGRVKEFFKSVFSAAYEVIKSIFSPIGAFFSGVWATIKSKFTDIGQRIGDAIGGTFKGAVNAVLSTIERVLNVPIKAINGLISVINLVPGVNLSKLSTFNLPRLAVGGIVNMPGKGIPIGSAIAGEAGREGVIPLTDPSVMAQLGQEIGKWITVNTTMNNYMDSRLISRSVNKKQSQLAFETNGGVK